MQNKNKNQTNKQILSKISVRGEGVEEVREDHKSKPSRGREDEILAPTKLDRVGTQSVMCINEFDSTPLIQKFKFKIQNYLIRKPFGVIGFPE